MKVRQPTWKPACKVQETMDAPVDGELKFLYVKNITKVRGIKLWICCSVNVDCCILTYMFACKDFNLSFQKSLARFSRKIHLLCCCLRS